MIERLLRVIEEHTEWSARPNELEVSFNEPQVLLNELEVLKCHFHLRHLSVFYFTLIYGIGAKL